MGERSMSYSTDTQFSKHKDELLKPFWGEIAYERRFVIASSRFLQETHGIDIIMQGKHGGNEVKLDTKHIRGSYSNFYLEEKSCPARGTLGWLLKPEEVGWPDVVPYCFWPRCQNCHNLCSQCQNEIFPTTIYMLEFKPLRDWFIEHYTEYPLHINTDTINKTTGRIVPIVDVQHIILNSFKVWKQTELNPIWLVKNFYRGRRQLNVPIRS